MLKGKKFDAFTLVGECQTIFWRPPDNLLVTAKRLRDICQAMCRTEFAHVMNGG